MEAKANAILQYIHDNSMANDCLIKYLYNDLKDLLIFSPKSTTHFKPQASRGSQKEDILIATTCIRVLQNLVKRIQPKDTSLNSDTLGLLLTLLLQWLEKADGILANFLKPFDFDKILSNLCTKLMEIEGNHSAKLCLDHIFARLYRPPQSSPNGSSGLSKFLISVHAEQNPIFASLVVAAQFNLIRFYFTKDINIECLKECFLFLESKHGLLYNLDLLPEQQKDPYRHSVYMLIKSSAFDKRCDLDITISSCWKCKYIKFVLSNEFYMAFHDDLLETFCFVFKLISELGSISYESFKELKTVYDLIFDKIDKIPTKFVWKSILIYDYFFICALHAQDLDSYLSEITKLLECDTPVSPKNFLLVPYLSLLQLQGYIKNQTDLRTYKFPSDYCKVTSSLYSSLSPDEVTQLKWTMNRMIQIAQNLLHYDLVWVWLTNFFSTLAIQLDSSQIMFFPFLSFSMELLYQNSKNLSESSQKNIELLLCKLLNANLFRDEQQPSLPLIKKLLHSLYSYFKFLLGIVHEYFSEDTFLAFKKFIKEIALRNTIKLDKDSKVLIVKIVDIVTYNKYTRKVAMKYCDLEFLILDFSPIVNADENTVLEALGALYKKLLSYQKQFVDFDFNCLEMLSIHDINHFQSVLFFLDQIELKSYISVNLQKFIAKLLCPIFFAKDLESSVTLQAHFFALQSYSFINPEILRASASTYATKEYGLFLAIEGFWIGLLQPEECSKVRELLMVAPLNITAAQLVLPKATSLLRIIAYFCFKNGYLSIALEYLSCIFKTHEIIDSDVYLFFDIVSILGIDATKWASNKGITLKSVECFEEIFYKHFQVCREDKAIRNFPSSFLAEKELLSNGQIPSHLSKYHKFISSLRMAKLFLYKSVVSLHEYMSLERGTDLTAIAVQLLSGLALLEGVVSSDHIISWQKYALYLIYFLTLSDFYVLMGNYSQSLYYLAQGQANCKSVESITCEQYPGYFTRAVQYSLYGFYLAADNETQANNLNASLKISDSTSILPIIVKTQLNHIETARRKKNFYDCSKENQISDINGLLIQDELSVFRVKNEENTVLIHRYFVYGLKSGPPLSSEVMHFCISFEGITYRWTPNERIMLLYIRIKSQLKKPIIQNRIYVSCSCCLNELEPSLNFNGNKMPGEILNEFGELALCASPALISITGNVLFDLLLQHSASSFSTDTFLGILDSSMGACYWREKSLISHKRKMKKDTTGSADESDLERIVYLNIHPEQSVRLISDLRSVLPTSSICISLSLTYSDEERDCESVCLPMPNSILMSRIDRHGHKFVRMPSKRQGRVSCQLSPNYRQEFRNILERNAEMTSANHLNDLADPNLHSDTLAERRVEWWKERERLDHRLKELLLQIQMNWLGIFVYWLLQIDEYDTLTLNVAKEKLLKILGYKTILTDDTLTAFVWMAKSYLSILDIDRSYMDLLLVDWIRWVSSLPENSNISLILASESDFDNTLCALRLLITGKLESAIRLSQDDNPFLVSSQTRNAKEIMSSMDENTSPPHVFLILDKTLLEWPLESIPALKGTSVSRVPSLQVLKELLMQRELSRYTLIDVTRPDQGVLLLLNPSGDLLSTQETIEHAFKGIQSGIPNLKSFVGCKPSHDLSSELLNCALYLYFGHGTGEQYLKISKFASLPVCHEDSKARAPVAFLMGCSSGALPFHGDFDAQGSPLDYLLYGSPCVVANLWDVTDKDSDRFSNAALLRFGLFSAEMIENSDPKKDASKRRTGRETRSLNHNSSMGTSLVGTDYPTAKSGAGFSSLALSVALSRDACLLPYLVGAAPVVYGLPVYLNRPL